MSDRTSLHKLLAVTVNIDFVLNYYCYYLKMIKQYIFKLKEYVQLYLTQEGHWDVDWGGVGSRDWKFFQPLT